MHRIALILMILLLPLRGWAGDVMAIGMAAGQLTAQLQAALEKPASVAAESKPAHPYEVAAAVHGHSQDIDSHASGGAEPVAMAQTMHDCGDMQAALPGEKTDNDEKSMTDCGTCPSCQACHTVALSVPAEKSIAILNPAVSPDTAAQAFASADVALSQKPPIS